MGRLMSTGMDRMGLAIERVGAIDRETRDRWNAAFPENEWVADNDVAFLVAPNNLLLLAAADGEPRGFQTAHRLQRPDRRGADVLIDDVAVTTAHRRRGIGARLIGAVTAWAQEVGADEVWALTDRGNAPAMALYAATGGSEDDSDTVMFTYAVGSGPG